MGLIPFLANPVSRTNQPGQPPFLPKMISMEPEMDEYEDELEDEWEEEEEEDEDAGIPPPLTEEELTALDKEHLEETLRQVTLFHEELCRVYVVICPEFLKLWASYEINKAIDELRQTIFFLKQVNKRSFNFFPTLEEVLPRKAKEPLYRVHPGEIWADCFYE